MSSRTAMALVARANRAAATFGRTTQLKTYLYVPAASKALTWRSYSTEKSAEKAAPSDPNATGTGAELSEDAKKFAQEVERLSAEISALKEQNGELLDKYKRALADGENLRVRLSKQISDAKLFGIQGFCKDLLEVADILGHATAAVPQEQIKEGNTHLKNLYEGLTMTKATLLQVFKRHGLEPMNPVNEKFDPNYHEALFQKEDKSVEPNMVVEVTKIGYKLHERCIRAALVGVSKS